MPVLPPDAYEMPPEVKAYFEKGTRRIVKVKANEDYTLTLTFDNGEVRIYDMNHLIHEGVFRILENSEKFQEVYLDSSDMVSWDIDSSVDSEVVWENKLNLCPDSCYIYSKPISEQ